MILAAIIIGLLVGLVILDETEVEARPPSRTRVIVKVRRRTNPHPGLDQ
jgi:hypothetical protein